MPRRGHTHEAISGQEGGGGEHDFAETHLGEGEGLGAYDDEWRWVTSTGCQL